ncbi:MAG: alpha/beta hydrolase [Candidatus Heimdallarchaeota archaeon]|nr:alpha/beta hydrolase [Candidatus Heimdallarchaeota archaeon]
MAVKNSQTEIDYVKQMKSNKLPFAVRAMRSYIKFLNKFSKKRATKLVTKLFLTPQRKVLRDDQLEYYNSGHSEFIKYNDQDVFVFTKGEGPRVMLAHGWGSNSYIFRFIIDSLVESGFSVVTLDYPAHGQSTGKQTNLPETSELVKLLSQKYGPLKAVIAYSFGGPTAIRAMEIGLETENLVLLSSPSKIESIFNPFFDLLDIKPELQELFIQELVAQTGINRNRISPMDMQYDKSVRTLIVHDKDDEIISDVDATLIHHELKNSRLIFTSKLGHRGVPRAEEIVSEITSFLVTPEPKIQA